jgi:alkylation response protein AidB-like acyl-CoA dehydrogenase
VSLRRWRRDGLPTILSILLSARSPRRNEEGVPDDFKVLSIFGGTTEIQKEIIARSLGL